MIVIADIAPVVVTISERPDFVVPDAALSRLIVSQVLMGRQSLQSEVRFGVLYAKFLRLDELFEELFECILAGLHYQRLLKPA